MVFYNESKPKKKNLGGGSGGQGEGGLYSVHRMEDPFALIWFMMFLCMFNLSEASN